MIALAIPPTSIWLAAFCPKVPQDATYTMENGRPMMELFEAISLMRAAGTMLT
jgi:hypothetical protein